MFGWNEGFISRAASDIAECTEKNKDGFRRAYCRAKIRGNKRKDDDL